MNIMRSHGLPLTRSETTTFLKPICRCSTSTGGYVPVLLDKAYFCRVKIAVFLNIQNRFFSSIHQSGFPACPANRYPEDFVSGSEHASVRDVFSMPVIVAALGYFVDIYDLVLFSIVRVPSLRDLGIEGKALVDEGVFLLNMQMIGMLLGGILWGWLGDKKGRLRIMFASILMYSLANLANGFVTSLPAYLSLIHI